MKSFKKSVVLLLAVFMVGMLFMPSMIVRSQALSNFTLEIGFHADYDPVQGRVEYQIDGGSWEPVTSNSSINIDYEVTSLKLRVVEAEYWQVSYDADGEKMAPYLADGGPGIAFQAGGDEMAAKRALLTGEGIEATLTDGLGTVSLTSVGFRGTTAQNVANVSFDITGPGLEFWEDDIPSRITFRLPGTEDIAMGKDNLEWKDGKRPPDATGVKTVNPVEVTYDYDNSGNVIFDYVISNANTKITSLIINDVDCTGSCPQTDAQILANIEDGGRSTKPISIEVPHAAAYDITVVAAEHDLMGGFGWNYLPEETQSGDAREDCIAHGTLEFIQGEYNGIVYTSISDWNNAEAYGAHVFNWTDGDKNYTDERDAWGSAAFPKEAKITLKLIPDEGYQLISLYGDQNLVREEEIGTYTITMAGGMNSHLQATFAEVGDVVNATSGAVTGGEVSNLQNKHGEGTMKLNVEDANISGESRTGFEGKADEEEVAIEDYIDINLANTIYKATDDPNEAWDREVKTLDEPATIKLELEKDYEGKELVVIHEHEGQYEVIPVEFDGRNTISFETSSFSNYAIATKTPEEDPENPEDPEDPEDPENPEEPGDEGDSGDEHYVLDGGDNILEFDDGKGADYSAVIMDFNNITDEELAAMGATRAEANAMVDAMKSALPKEFLNLYVVMILDNETGEQVWGRQNLVLKIKKTDDMNGYENFRIVDVSEFGEDSFKVKEIKGVEKDGYLVFKLDETGNFALIADKAKKSGGQSDGRVNTGDENSMFFWIALVAAAAITIGVAKRAHAEK